MEHRLAVFLAGRGMTQEQLAEASGVICSNWRLDPSLHILSEVKTALNCSWEDLLGGIPCTRSSP
jgi:transcriptional regulator with XRE-family HTH domain